MEGGDELWTFCCSGDNWNSLAGWKGIAMLRSGELLRL